MGKIDAVGLVFPVHPVPLNNSVFMDMVGEISHELARHEIDLLLIADDDWRTNTAICAWCRADAWMR
ncbi:hypothetical protein ACVXG7_09645 [Enterobacter hormaechei]